MKKRGFSLVELLVVVAIIGILSVILVPNVQEQLRRAKVAKTRALISSLEVAIDMYKNDFGKYPASYNPQELYLSLVENAKHPYEPSADEYRLFKQGDHFWVNDKNPAGSDRIEQLLNMAGVPAKNLVAQEEENAFVDAWENPIYYISYEVYNPTGRSDFRRMASQRGTAIDDNLPCAYEMKDNSRYRPFNPNSYQLISFGPDGTTITPSRTNGGIGSMIDSDKKDNDDDGFFDNEDRVRRGNREKNDVDVVAEDDVTNFQ